MPVYSFECENGHQSEAVQRFTDPMPDCPYCEADTHRVILHAPKFSLKGTGWAAEGYRGTDMGAQAESDRAERIGEGKSGIVSFPGQKNKGRA